MSLLNPHFSKKDVFIHSSAEISDFVRIGKNTNIWNNVQIRSHAIIGNHCNLGKDVYIDHKVCIGHHVKIQNGVSLYQGITVDDFVFIGPYVVFTNDKYPRSFKADWTLRETFVNKGASIGANATILCGISIGEFSMIGAGSVVTRDVPPSALVVGNPARVVGFVCQCGNKLHGFEKRHDDYIGICSDCKEETTINSRSYEALMNQK